MIRSLTEYRAMRRVYNSRARDAEKLQKMLLGAGASVENVQQEMAPLFAEVVSLRAELAEFESAHGAAPLLKSEARRLKKSKSSKAAARRKKR
jgi:hypothetical protein